MSAHSAVAVLSAAGLTAAAFAGPVESFDVFKNVYHTQTIADVQPDIESSNYACTMRLIATDDASIDTVSCAWPGPGSPATIHQPGAQVFVLFNSGVTTADDLDFFFPSGTYTFTASGPAIPLGGQGDLNYPSTRMWTQDVPFLTGSTLDDLNTMDVTQDFLGTLNPFTPGPGSNEAATFVTIYDQSGVVYNTYFDPSDTQFVIPADTLVAGQPYDIYIFFSSRVRTVNAGFDGAFSLAGWDRITKASFQPPVTPFCPTDFNRDGFLDFTDFDDFVIAFENGEARSDFNLDGFLDFTDFDAFVAAFEAGC